jgi:hypothetical protein
MADSATAGSPAQAERARRGRVEMLVFKLQQSLYPPQAPGAVPERHLKGCARCFTVRCGVWWRPAATLCHAILSFSSSSIERRCRMLARQWRAAALCATVVRDVPLHTQRVTFLSPSCAAGALFRDRRGAELVQAVWLPAVWQREPWRRQVRVVVSCAVVSTSCVRCWPARPTPSPCPWSHCVLQMVSAGQEQLREADAVLRPAVLSGGGDCS